MNERGRKEGKKGKQEGREEKKKGFRKGIGVHSGTACGKEKY